MSSIKDSVFLRDVVNRYNIRNVQPLEKLFVYLADQIGNTLSARSIAGFLKNQYRSMGVETVYNYLTYMERAYLFERVPRYDNKGKKLLETLEKYYIADLGLGHSLKGYQPDAINGYLENCVYWELRRRNYTVSIGKWENLEVDFVAEKQEERIYIQVSYLRRNCGEIGVGS